MTSNLFLVSVHSDRPFYDKTFDLTYLQKRFLTKSTKKNLSFRTLFHTKVNYAFEIYNDKNK